MSCSLRTARMAPQMDYAPTRMALTAQKWMSKKGRRTREIIMLRTLRNPVIQQPHIHRTPVMELELPHRCPPWHKACLSTGLKTKPV